MVCLLGAALSISAIAESRPLHHKPLHRHGVHHAAGVATTGTPGGSPTTASPISAGPASNALDTAKAPTGPVAASALSPAAARDGVYRPACDPAPTRADAEYCQLAKAAEAQAQSARWALGQFVVAVVGVIAIVLVLWFARRAAQAAAKAAGAAEKAVLDLERPYVFVHGVDGVDAPTEDGHNPRILFNISNNGRLAARIDTISIACGPETNGTLPPLKMQDRHALLQHPVLSADEERRQLVYDLPGETSATRHDGNPGADCDLEDGMIFQVLIEYRGSAGQPHETGQVWKYHKQSRGWSEVADPHHSYMT